MIAVTGVNVEVTSLNDKSNYNSLMCYIKPGILGGVNFSRVS